MTEAEATGSAEFAERMLHMMNEAAVALMVSVGHRTGLFDVMAGMPAATSAEIASSAALDERYVREWLAVMTTGRIVDHDGATGSFSLPGEHAAWLTRAAGLNNLAIGMQYIGLLALVEDQIVDCFRHGGGVPYSAFPKFQAIMAEDSGAVHDATLIDVTLPLVPGLIDRLRYGIDVADVGCGSGHAVSLMAEAFPRSRFTGFDFSDTGIASARAEADRKDLTNVRFEKRDAARLGEIARFDFITTFDAVHDQARPDLVLAGIARALRPDGVLPLRGHLRLQQALGQSGPPTRTIPVHRLLHALHDRLPRRRRNGPRHDVGRANGTEDAQRGGLHLDRGHAPRRRHRQYLHHRRQERPACRELTTSCPRIRARPRVPFVIVG